MSELGHIRVVDDDAEVCASVEEYLTGQGYRVTISNHGAGRSQALERAKDFSVDKVLPMYEELYESVVAQEKSNSV